MIGAPAGDTDLGARAGIEDAVEVGSRLGAIRSRLR